MEQERRLKGLIDPREQVTIDEQLLAQPSGEIGQAPAEAGPELQMLEQKQGDERGPDLNLQRVGTADESFDAEVLPERLEERLDLSALAVDGREGRSGKATAIKHAAVQLPVPCSWAHRAHDLRPGARRWCVQTRREKTTAPSG
jgi:hypothetical protein